MPKKVFKKYEEDFEIGNYGTHAAPMTAEDAEDELISLAVDVARRRLLDGSASNQLVSEIIKMGTVKERLQKEKLQKENELLRAKTENLKSQKNMEELYAKAIEAMRSYSPTPYEVEETEDDMYE